MSPSTEHRSLGVADTLRLIQKHHGTVVLLKCDPPEDGQFWFAPFSKEELESWWMKHESFDVYNENTDMIYRIFGQTPPAHRKFDVPGLFVGFDNNWDLQRAWLRLRKRREFYTGKICCDFDSYLERPDGRRIFHPGFRGDASQKHL